MHNFRLLSQVPELDNQLYTVFYIEQDDYGQMFYAKIFSIAKLQEYGLDEALEYNQEVLSDMDCMAFPEHINKIILSVPNQGIFTFITQPYDTNLENYMRKTRINEAQALRIFDNVLKAVYSVYAAGYWHKSIRPEHFVKIDDVWKLDSLVYLQDHNKTQKLSSEYVWNNAYQPPECYERDIHKFSDQEFLPIVVWNLGSLLLDLFFSVHKLKNYEILQWYKGKKFSLENIKVKKTDLFSKKLKDILGSMLHYDPRARMRLQEVFSNDYLSKQVAMLFKQKHKNSLKGAPVKIFIGGKSALSSALKSKEERQRGDKVLPLNEIVKSAIQNLENNAKKLSEVRNAKSVQLETDADSGGKASMAQIFDRFLPKKNQSGLPIKTISRLQSSQILANNEFIPVIRMYQTMIDKSEILSVAGNKFQDIEYKENKKEITLISQYAVEMLSYLNLRKIFQDFENEVNFLDFDQSMFNKFKSAKQCEGLKMVVKEKIHEKTKRIAEIKQSIDQLTSLEKKITQETEIKDFLSQDLKSLAFSDIKVSYRKILKISYDFVTKEYNKDLSNQKLARTAMYVVYCLTIDKLYLPNLMDKNFLPFFEWFKEKPSPYIPHKKFQKYIEEANSNTLVAHAKELLERFFKL